MKRLAFVLVPLVAVTSGCATGYTAKSVEQGHEQPKHTLLLVEGLVFQKQPGLDPAALVRDESLAFGEAMASGICARLEKQGVDCKSIVMSGVQNRDFTLWVAESLEGTNAAPAAVPVEAPAKWREDPAKAAALSSVFTTLDAYSDSAVAFGAPRHTKFPDRVKPSKLAFSPDDFTTLFGRSITSVVILAQGSALARRKSNMMTDVGIALGIGIASAILSGGNGYVMPGGPVSPWFAKAVAVDTSTGEVLWADILVAQTAYEKGGKHGHQETGGDILARRCELFKAAKK